MELAVLQFLECVPAALALGVLVLPLLSNGGSFWGERRFGGVVAGLATFRAAVGIWGVWVMARSVVGESGTLDLGTVTAFAAGTIVGRAWILTELAALGFAAATLYRTRLAEDTPKAATKAKTVDRAILILAVLVVAAAPVTGHVLDDTLPIYARFSFLVHTAAGLLWFGGLLGLVWWMIQGRRGDPERALLLAERWSMVAKVAMVAVLVTGVILTIENVGSVPRLLSTTYGRMLIVKVSLLCAVLLIALSLVLYQTRVARNAFSMLRWGLVAGAEATVATVLVFVAGWLAVTTPALHDDELVWPLPFRISWRATWGLGVPSWGAAWWEAIAGGVFLAAALALWFWPRLRQWRRYTVPSSVLTAAVLGLVSLSVQAYPDTYRLSTVPFSAESVARGYDLFQANCIACHGEGGEGDGPAAKGLTPPPANLTAPHVATHTLGDIFHWIGEGPGPNSPMPAFTSLTEDEKWDLINFMWLLSTTYQSRLLTTESILQFLVAPDVTLREPKGERIDLWKLRGTPVVLSIADCKASDLTAPGVAEAGLVRSDAVAQEKKVPHIVVAGPGCPAVAGALVPLHPEAVFRAMALLNRTFSDLFTNRVEDAHFLIDRSGYLRARFRHIADDDAMRMLRREIDKLAVEPVVEIPEDHAH